MLMSPDFIEPPAPTAIVPSSNQMSRAEYPARGGDCPADNFERRRRKLSSRRATDGRNCPANKLTSPPDVNGRRPDSTLLLPSMTGFDAGVYVQRDGSTLSHIGILRCIGNICADPRIRVIPIAGRNSFNAH